MFITRYSRYFVYLQCDLVFYDRYKAVLRGGSRKPKIGFIVSRLLGPPINRAFRLVR